MTREVGFVDVVARKDGATAYAEAKGGTTSPGLDVDTMYGQLLRRTPPCRRRRGGDHFDLCRMQRWTGESAGRGWWFAGARVFAEPSAESAAGCAGVRPPVG